MYNVKMTRINKQKREYLHGSITRTNGGYTEAQLTTRLAALNAGLEPELFLNSPNIKLLPFKFPLFNDVTIQTTEDRLQRSVNVKTAGTIKRTQSTHSGHIKCSMTKRVRRCSVITRCLHAIAPSRNLLIKRAQHTIIHVASTAGIES
jgi:hypothetical protein